MASKPVPSTDPKCVVRAGDTVAPLDDYDAELEFTLTETQCAALQPGEKAGRGSFASAYYHRTNPEQVVKFTADPNDAKASIRLQGKNLKGSVNVYRIVRLKGVDGVADVMDKDGKWKDRKKVPIYGIITERVDPEGLNDSQDAVVSLVNGKMPYLRSAATSTPPKQFKLADWVDPHEIETKCKRQPHRAAGCQKAVEQVFDAIDELANEGGVIATDVHSGNWGVRANGDLVMLDFGVSHAEGKTPPIRSLAGNSKKRKNMATKKKKARARRPSLPRTYDYTLGADLVPGGSRVVGLSTTGKVTLGLLAAGALAWLFWPKKAAAAETPADKAIPTNVDAPAAAGSTTVTKDPGSGVAIVGNTGKLATSQSYVIKAGDAGWSNLASRTYGDYRWWPALWDANRSGTKFQNPDILRIGDVIVIPSLPVNDAKFKAAVFARAEADRAWSLAKRKAAAAKKAFTTPRPAIVSVATPVSTSLLPASAGGSASVDQGITPSSTTSSPNINAGAGVTDSTANPTAPTTFESMDILTAEQQAALNAKLGK